MCIAGHISSCYVASSFQNVSLYHELTIVKSIQIYIAHVQLLLHYTNMVIHKTKACNALQRQTADVLL